MKLGEFRRLTKHLPDHVDLEVNSDEVRCVTADKYSVDLLEGSPGVKLPAGIKVLWTL